MVLTFTHMLAHVLMRVHLAIFPIIRKEFNLSLLQLGIIASVPHVVQVILSIPIGILVDRFGSKRMIITSLCIAIIASLVGSLTLDPFTLALAVSLVYLTTTVYHASSYSFLTNIFRGQNTAKAIGIQDIGGNLGTAIGPISVSVLIGALAFSWRQVYLFWFLPILLGVLCIHSLNAKPREDVKRSASSEVLAESKDVLMFSSSLALFLIFITLKGLAGSMVEVFVPIYLVDEKKISETLSSLIFGSSMLVGMVGAPVGGFLGARYGEKRWLLVIIALGSTALGLSVVLPSLFAFVAMYMIYELCNSLQMSSRSAIMARLSPSRNRGLGYALYFLPGSLMGVIAPIIAAGVASSSGLASIFIVAMVIYIVSLFLLRFGVKIPKHNPE
jgi:FSR family fosmidomycin resistance protein-like MFS transporter